MILEDLLDNLPLLQGERGSLFARGFDNEVVSRYKLRSCHPSNAYVLDRFAGKYGMEVLVETQLYEADENYAGVYTPQRQLLSPNVLIPYFRPDKSISKIRPHKLGFKGQGAQVFHTFTSFLPCNTCVIAESEFKAIAAECFGFSAIGIPGIASMSGKNWDYFARELEAINARDFVICFDNEIKSDPTLKNFKPDWRKRYDTIIYAYAMAQKILNLGKTCRIATLPATWMVDGKIDIDTALGQQRTSDDFHKVIQSAQGPKAFLETAPIPPKHRNFVSRRIKRFFFDPQIAVKYHCFYSKESVADDGTVKEGVKLSNFILKIQNVYEEIGTETEGVLRDVVLIDDYGVPSKPVSLKAPSMSSRGSFKEWLMSQGNYIFYGNENDLTKIWEYVFSYDDGNVVYLVNQCGYIKEFNFYLFKNVLIKDGRAILPDELGIFWIDEVGYKPHEISDQVPLPTLQTEGKFDIHAFIKMLSDTVDSEGVGMGKTLMAWVFAVYFLEEIQQAFKLFPIFFIYGSRGSGKTTILRWLMSFFGQERATAMTTGSSMVGVNRGLAYYSGLPFAIDDWRNNNRNAQFLPLFLGIYNRQSGLKGVRSKFGLQVTSVKAALAILSEELIPDNAVMSRCLSFYMPTVRLQECSSDVEDIIGKASAFTYQFLTTQFKKSRESVVKKIYEYIQVFKNRIVTLDTRVAINFAILAGAYETVLGPDKDMLSYIYGLMGSNAKKITEGDKLHQFAEEFLVCLSNFELQPHYYLVEEDKIFLWVKGICDTLNKYYNRHIDNTQIITEHLQRQPYFVRQTRKALRPGSFEVPVVELTYAHMTDSMQFLFEGLVNAAKNNGAGLTA